MYIVSQPRLSTNHVVCQSGIDLPPSTKTAKRVEHAGAHEADEGDHQQLDPGRRIPGQLVAEDAESLVFPSAREVEGVDGSGLVEIGVVERSGIDGSGIVAVNRAGRSGVDGFVVGSRHVRSGGLGRSGFLLRHCRAAGGG